MKKVLFVDDEKSILKSLQRLYFDSTDYELFTAESAEEGLNILNLNPIDVVVTDLRLLGMSGHQFLKKVKILYPNTTRIILSGQADEKVVLPSIIDGSSNLYIFKPWENEDIKIKIEQIFEFRQIFTNPALLKIANRLENIALITKVYDSVCQLIDQEAPISAIAKVIEQDPAVTVAVLRVVNSAFYNVKIGSVGQALTFIGLTAIKSIVLSCSLLKMAQIKVPPFTLERLTKHSSTTNAYMAKIYKELLHKPLPDNLSTAGLLHNVGLVICLHHFPDVYKSIAEKYATRTTNISLSDCEKEVFGISHNDLGGYLLNWWNIPYSIVECALFHHDPLHHAVMNREAVCVVHIANYYAWKAIIPSAAADLVVESFSVLGLEQYTCERLLRNSCS